jgi:hypothetical protein
LRQTHSMRNRKVKILNSHNDLIILDDARTRILRFYKPIARR